MNQFPTKHPDESFAIEIDFTKLATIITSATVTVGVYLGTDPAPANLLYSTPQITGAKVLQRVVGGVAGVTYRLKVAATDGTNTWVHEHLLPVDVDR